MDAKYGGIALDIVDTEEITRRMVYSEDGSDYLHTYWRVPMICIMNPQTAMALNAALSPAKGTPAPTADTNIRHPLCLPRKTLTLSMNGVTFLQTPAPGYTTDAANGPFPVSFDILEVCGDKTLKCRYVIEARVNECPGTGRPIILSQRWRQLADVDEDYFMTRTTAGTIIFRSDELLAQNVTPDQVRENIGHPIPINCKRDNIQVAMESDGLTYHYTFTDSEKPFNLTAAAALGLTRIEAYETQWMSFPDPSQVVSDFVGEALPNLFHPLQIGGSAIRAIGNVVPRFYKSVWVRAWGHRASTRVGLTAMAMNIIAGRIPEINDPTAFVAKETTVSHDLTGKFVDVSTTVRRGANPIVAWNLFVNGNGAGPFSWPSSDRLAGPGGQVLTTQDPTIQTTPPPNSIATRGTSLALMIAQALGTPCAAPATPENFRLSSGTQGYSLDGAT